MWNRKELKRRGKEAFLSNYWPCVGITAISFAITVLITFTKLKSNIFIKTTYYVWLFLSLYVSLGMSKFFLCNSKKSTGFSSFKDGALRNCGKNLVTIFVMYMRIMIIPVIILVLGIFMTPGRSDSVSGIIFTVMLCIVVGSIITVISYNYKMVWYILVDKPELSTNETLELSKAMMDGNKMNAFIFDISFLGWDILGIASCSILNLFYVLPYKSAASAELYLAIRESESSVKRQGN